MGVENGTNKKHTELIGVRFGRFTVIEDVTTTGRTKLLCRCDCGNKKIVRLDHLKSGAVVSCGCYQAELRIKATRTHGMSKTRIYGIWKGIHNRCENNNIPQYADWGGRGIKVCEEWQTFEPFYEWAMANGYRDDLTIDRKDNDGDYCPDNCRWTTRKEQALNRRSNTFITYSGITKHISEWDKDIGSLKSGRVRARLNAGWSVEKAVTTLVVHRKR